MNEINADEERIFILITPKRKMTKVVSADFTTDYADFTDFTDFTERIGRDFIHFLVNTSFQTSLKSISEISG